MNLAHNSPEPSQSSAFSVEMAGASPWSMTMTTGARQSQCSGAHAFLEGVTAENAASGAAAMVRR